MFFFCWNVYSFVALSWKRFIHSEVNKLQNVNNGYNGSMLGIRITFKILYQNFNRKILKVGDKVYLKSSILSIILEYNGIVSQEIAESETRTVYNKILIWKWIIYVEISQIVFLEQITKLFVCYVNIIKNFSLSEKTRDVTKFQPFTCDYNPISLM